MSRRPPDLSRKARRRGNEDAAHSRMNDGDLAGVTRGIEAMGVTEDPRGNVPPTWPREAGTLVRSSDHGSTRVTVPAFLILGGADHATDLIESYHVVGLEHANLREWQHYYPGGTTWTLCVHRDLSADMMAAYVRHVALMTAERVHSYYITTGSNVMTLDEFLGTEDTAWQEGYPVGWDARPGRRLRLYPMHSMLHTVNGMLRDTSRLWSTDREPLQVHRTNEDRFFIVPNHRQTALTNVGLGNDVSALIAKMATGMEGGDERAVVVTEQTWLDAEARAVTRQQRQRLDAMRKEYTGRDGHLPPLSHTGHSLSARTMERIVRDPRPATLDTETTWAMLSHAAPFGADSNLVNVARCPLRILGRITTGYVSPSGLLCMPFYEHGTPTHILHIRRDHPALAPLHDRTDFLC